MTITRNVKKGLVFTGLGLGVVLLVLFVTGQLLASLYNRGLDNFQTEQIAAYEKTMASYKTEADRVNDILGKVLSNPNLPSFEEKAIAQEIVFDRLQPELKVIADADGRFVANLEDAKPSIPELPLLPTFSPTYKKALDRQAKLDETITSLQRDIVAEQFFATGTNAQDFFESIAKLQRYIEIIGLGKLADIFGAAIPASNQAEADTQKYLKTAKQNRDVIYPGVKKVAENTPVPDDEYYLQKKQQAIDLFAEGVQMSDLFVKGYENNDAAALEQAKAIQNRNDGEIQAFGRVFSNGVMAVYVDLAAMEQHTKTLFEL